MGQRKNAVLQGVACALTCRMTVPSHVEHSRFLSGLQFRLAPGPSSV